MRPLLLPGIVLLLLLPARVLAASIAPQVPADLDIGSPATLRAPDMPRQDEVNDALARGDLEHAERLLVEEIERRPESPALLKFLAGVFLIDRKPLNAAIALKKAEAFGPLDDATRFALALAYVAIQRRDWARPELERLTKADPEDARYLYWLARIDYDEGEYPTAIERLERVVALDPAFVRAHDNLGLCHEAQDQPDEAIRHYREAIRLNRAEARPSPWPPLNLGILLRSRGEMEEAEALLREAVRHDATLAQARYELGSLLEQTKRTGEAVAELTRAAELDPAYPQPHYALARIYRRQGREADANRELEVFKRLYDAKQGARP